MAKRKKRSHPYGNRIDEVSAWDAEDVVTPAVYAVPLLCVPSEVSENLS